MDRKSNQKAAKKRIDELFAQLDEFEKKKNEISEDLRAEYESSSLAIKAAI